MEDFRAAKTGRKSQPYDRLGSVGFRFQPKANLDAA